MNSKNIRPYELSLWTLQDSFIAVLARSGEGQIETPKCSLKNDGTQELNFSFPMYIREKGELVENPIWYSYKNGLLIENMRKLKLLFNKGEEEQEIIEFLITKVIETHTGGTLKCEVSAEGLIFHELGKVGYKISLSQTDFEEEYEKWWNGKYASEEEKKACMPIQNLQYWADKIFKDSDWTYEVQMDWSCYDANVNRKPNKIYEDEYIGSWKDDGSGNPIPNEIITLQEKARPVEIEKSNRYNITQTLAEIFGVYCRYKYEYDENYHIIGKKCIFYNNYLQDKEEKFDINYPYDASKIEREKDSVDIITKMYVVPMESDVSTSGLITIADATPNKLKEDYILNFDYLYKIGTISQEQYDTIADYERTMFNINTELEPLTSQIIKLNSDLVSYKAERQNAISSQTYDKEQMNQALAFLNTLTNGTGILEKTTNNPYVGTLLQRDDYYYLKITQEGVLPDTIEIYYKIKDESSTLVLEKYTGPYEKVYDQCGNLIELSKLTYDSNLTSVKRYYITFQYKPSLQYENIYNTFAKKLSEDEIKEQKANSKVNEINKKFEDIEKKQKNLIEKKQAIIADFENIMGPALREGSWAPEDYDDYGIKYSSKIRFGWSNDSNLTLFWDSNYFEEEEDANYYTTFGSDGNTLQKNYYLSIDLTNHLEQIKNNLTNLSYISDDGNQILTIGSELKILFYKRNSIIKPVLVLAKDTAKKGGKVAVISSTITNGTADISTKTLFQVENSDWLNAKDYTLVYPRIEVNSSLLRTSDDTIQIKSDGELLQKFYDYYILYRDNRYYITIKSEPMIVNCNPLTKEFDITYELSSASLNIYLDALEVAKTNSMPQVSYTIDVSAWKETFIKTLYKKLNCVVMINDAELKFEEVQGYISEVELNLNNPWEDTVVVQNYKTKFEDLFSSIVASTEQMKTNSFSYNNAANAFTSSGTLRPNVIQDTLNRVDLTYAFQSGDLTIDELNGIWATSESGVVAMRGGGIFCATTKDQYGNWLWNTGITPSGINASLINAGQLDTNLIKIYAGNNLRLQLNGDGLFAYKRKTDGEANFNEYVVHNEDGLFLTNVTSLGSKINRVEISWDGLVLRNKDGDSVFYADPDTGNLIIAGGATIAKGSTIAGWILEDNYLYSDKHGGIAKIKSGPSIIDNETGKLESPPYEMLYFQGAGDQGGIFKVDSDGTLYAKNAIIEGTITASSFIGTTSVEELNNTIKSLSIYTFNDDCFRYYNDNLDGNITIDPSWLRFQILKNGLTKKELTDIESGKSIWSFYYCIPQENEVSPESISDEGRWTEISLSNNVLISFDANYLTFIVKSDIMYQENNMHNILFFKFINKGCIREVDKNGKLTNNYISKNHEVSFILNTIDYGTNKFLSQIQPPSYTFIGDSEKGWQESTQFTVTLKNLNPYEGNWIAEGNLIEQETILIGNADETTTGTTANQATIYVTDANINDGKWYIDDTLVSSGDEINADDNLEIETPIYDSNGNIIGYHIEINYAAIKGVKIIIENKQIDENTATSTITIPSAIIEVGGQINIKYNILKATRNAFCFKTRNGVDGVIVNIESSSGDSFTNGDIRTVLTTKMYFGSQLVNSDDASIQYYYVWKKDGAAMKSIVSPRLGEDGNPIIMPNPVDNPDNPEKLSMFKEKSILITGDDVKTKNVFSCFVFDSESDAYREYQIDNKIN